MTFSMTGQEKGDCLIGVTAWACLTVYKIRYIQRLYGLMPSMHKQAKD